MGEHNSKVRAVHTNIYTHIHTHTNTHITHTHAHKTHAHTAVRAFKDLFIAIASPALCISH